MARRFFVDKDNISGNSVTITGSEHLHLTKVLRAKPKDKIDVSTLDFCYMCEIETITKNKTICKILQKEKIENSAPNITLFQASMKGEHMEYIIQKATEVGIKTFVPFLSQFVVAKIDSKKTDRFQKISQEACKQSGRKTPMEILDVITFSKLLELLKDYDKIIFAYENSKVPAKEVLSELEAGERIALVVGCEGGFSETEAKTLAKAGAKEISLGENILRGETAGLVLSSIVLFELNQFKKI